ncbi:hypothetical protein TRFO_04322 [Tritrichomonas foetus]|uniref:Protein HGH1 homolog n=1 Tax=Tritrichomonas foetus TaxID=1144522 RepID=A0A1J4KKR3_9EUKA|nr:hypothetical protein TRFO_04322 [Tritrichomonas foetus]|eukprot:OHT10286.1 hypothetical protein TRFO_04322 [Tritrichomonas foetus]
MEDTIKQLQQYLQRPEEQLLIQATEICKSFSSTAENSKQLMELIPDLLRLTSSSNEEIARNSLVTLINMTSHLPAAIDKIIGLNGVTRQMDSVISHDANLVHDRLMLLTNLTTQNSGCLQILDLQDKDLRGQRLLRLAVRYTSPPDSFGIPKAAPLNSTGMNLIATSNLDDYEYAAMVLMNATLMPEGRQIFFSTPDFFMPALLDSISGDNPIRKQGIIGVIRNLCFDSSKHEFLMKTAKVLPALIRPLFHRNLENNVTAAEMLHEAFPGIVFGDPEPLAINRRNILEALLLLAQSESGKEFLTSHHVVFVMRELDEYETDQENKELGLRIGALLMGPQEEDENPEPDDVE